MKRIAVIGASGYAGIEAVRLIAGHPDLELVLATGDSQAGQPIAGLYPHLRPLVGDRTFDAFDPTQPLDADGAVVALPHGASMDIMAELLEPHRAPDLLASAVYSIPEFCRDRIPGARIIANPGCYPTAASLAMAPLVRAGLVDSSHIIVDAASGVSGAGRPPKPNTTFCTVDENFTAYGLLTHRHTAEMEAHLDAGVLFTPHLAPMNRGILATSYADPAPGAELTTEVVLAALADAYADEPFIDNLVKGTAGQAIQCLNLMVGLDEPTGLPRVGVTP